MPGLHLRMSTNPSLVGFAGHEYTVISDGAGHVVTLAESGVGVATSVGGSLFTVATSVADGVFATVTSKLGVSHAFFCPCTLIRYS
jgi:hypothetical protein